MLRDHTHLRQRVETLAESTGTLEAYNTLANTLKSLSESEKAATDIQNQEKLLRFEWLKSTATTIVPLLTLLTLAVTVYFQWDQARITTRANEDAQWRSLADAMTKPPGAASDIVITTGLIPFYNSPRYRDQAYQVVFMLAHRVVNANTVRILYETAFGNPDWSNAADTVRLGRIIDQGYAEWDDTFNKLGGVTELALRAKEQRKSIYFSRDAVTLDEASHVRTELLKAEKYLTDRVGELLRSARAEPPLYSDFAEFPFFKGDLSRANLGDLDISGSDFHWVDLDGAILSPSKFDNSYWYGTKWWQASKIDPNLLIYLIKNGAPYSHDDESYTPDGSDSPRINKEDYVKAVARLCHEARVDCDLGNLPFGMASTAAESVNSEPPIIPNASQPTTSR